MSSKKEIIDLSKSINFQITVLSNYISRPHYENIGEKTGINISEWRILLSVGSNPGIMQSEIADVTGLHKMTISRSLKSLKTYLILKPHSEDRRRRIVFLSPQGEALYQEALPSLRERQGLLVEPFTPEEQMKFLLMLRRMIAVAQEW